MGKRLVSDLKDINSLLDLGSGDGTITLQFAKVLGAKELYAIEYQDEMHQLLIEKGIKVSKLDVNETWHYSDEFFDFVLSSQNIEHVHRSRHYLEECYRVIKPGGHLLIMTENLASWPNILALLLGWQPFSTTPIEGWIVGNPYAVHGDAATTPTKEAGRIQIENSQFAQKYYQTGISGTTGHVRVLSYEGLKALMIKTGFESILVDSTGFPPFSGKIAEILHGISRKHGHFLLGFGRKPIPGVTSL